MSNCMGPKQQGDIVRSVIGGNQDPEERHVH